VGLVHVHGPLSRQDMERRQSQILDAMDRPTIPLISLYVLATIVARS